MTTSPARCARYRLVAAVRVSCGLSRVCTQVGVRVSTLAAAKAPRHAINLGAKEREDPIPPVPNLLPIGSTAGSAHTTNIPDDEVREWEAVLSGTPELSNPL